MKKVSKKIISVILAIATAFGLSAQAFGSFASTDNSDSSKVATSESASITYYVAIDGKWTLVSVGSTDKREYRGSVNRYYVTAEELEEVYKNYGFKASEYKGEPYFPHADDYAASGDRMWADCSAQYSDSENTYHIPVSFRTNNFIYYVPNNKEGYDSYFTTSKSINDQQLQDDNSFYSVSVNNNKGYIDSSKVPKTKSYIKGTNVTVTLPIVSDATWKAYNGTTFEPIDIASTTDETAGTVTFEITNISCAIQFGIMKSKNMILYNAATLKSNLQSFTGQFTASAQAVKVDGTINGKANYGEENNLNGTTVLAPDKDYAIAAIISSNSNNRKYNYSFDGWKIHGTSIVYKPGDTITTDIIEKYANSAGILLLDATWSMLDTHGRPKTVNFYLDLDCEIMDNISNGFQSHSDSKFTSSLYATRIFGTDDLTQGSGGFMIVAPPTEAETAYSIDKLLRNSTTTPIDGMTIESFPSDESILSNLRKGGVTFKLDGNSIASSDLTTENFTIRWYVLKYEKSDAWHIDGVLVAKQGKMVITKTFAGDDAAISQVKPNFNITVKHNDDSNGTYTDYTLSLKSKKGETDSTKTGYTYYDADTDTYVWVLSARQYREYTIEEHNYLLDQDEWNHTNKYMIYNSDDDTHSWLPYDSSKGVTIEAEAYPNDVPYTNCQTVAFTNTYIQSGLLTVSKIDSDSRNGMKNVNFKLSLVNGRDLTLYRKPGTSQYSTDTNAPLEGYTEKVDGNILTTDNNGNFYVKLAIHSEGKTSEEYYLEEEIPIGYEGAKKIKVTVSDNGKVEMAQEVIESTLTSESEWLEGEGTTTLTIKNHSKQLTSVKAKKVWSNTPDEDKLPVVVELWVNGAKIQGSKFTQTLSEDNNWQYEWNNLPLYIDGEPAQYALRETMIGSTAYDPSADSDGYADYMVSYDKLKYRENDGDYGTDATWLDSDGVRHFANNALLVVNNVEQSGDISFTKIDEDNNALSGAEFTLYSDKDCTKELATATSNESGFVVFSHQNAGTYYMKETAAPNGYLPNENLYKIVIKNGVATITKDGETTAVTHIMNYYKAPRVDFTFIKTDNEDDPLANAEFALYKLVCTDESHDHSNDILTVDGDGNLTTSNDCWELVSTQKSAEKTGRVSFTKLDSSLTYRLIEYSAPLGYKTPKGQWEIQYLYGTDNPDFKITAVGDVANTPAFAEQQYGRIKYRLPNYKKEDLPTAGDTGIYKYLTAGVIMLTAGGVLILVAIKRKRRE